MEEAFKYILKPILNLKSLPAAQDIYVNIGPNIFYLDVGCLFVPHRLQNFLRKMMVVFSLLRRSKTCWANFALENCWSI